MKGIQIEEEEYYEKRLEVAQNLLPQMVAKVSQEFMLDTRKRASLIYNCVSISEDLMKEAGITIKPPRRQLNGDPVPKKANINDRRSNKATGDGAVSAEALKQLRAESAIKETTSTDLNDRTAIKKLSEMLPEK